MASIKYKDPDTGKFIRIPIYKIGLDGDSDKNYIHTQATPATTWSIKHELDKLPSVTIINSSGDLSFGNITYIDNDNLEITFSAAISGKAILN